MRAGLRVSALVIALAVPFALAAASADAAFGPLGEDLRLSFMGPNGSTAFAAFLPSVAYNPTADEYLVVWHGDDNTAPLVNEEYEIFAQRLSGSGAPLGGRIRVSEQGADGNPASLAFQPSVAYNPAANEYLVAWTGEIGTSSEVEIWAQRLSAAGAEVGGSDFQVSDMGPDGNPSYNAVEPSVVANPTANEYLVVWRGDDNTAPLVDEEYEVFGQRLTAAGAQTGTNDFRISAQGADGNPDSAAVEPSVAYDSTANEYLVAWTGDVGTGTSDELEIWARRLSAVGERVGGSDDLQISDMGPAADAGYDALIPRVAANPTANEYLVVWLGDDDTAPLVNDEFEIFGQRLTAAGAQTGTNDFRISAQGPDGNPASQAFEPSVAHDPAANEYLVAWRGEIGTSSEFEIWAQRLSAAGAEVGGSDFQVSDMGPDSNPSYNAFEPSVAATPTAGEYLVVWYGDDNTAPLVDDEIEIFGRRLGLPAPTLVGTDPVGPANNNSPRVKGSIGSVDPASTIDVFNTSSCSGAPVVNDAPGGDLIGSGISVPVADNSTTQFSATASGDGHTSRCSNSISYTEQTPPATGGGGGGEGGGGPAAFGARTLVTLRLAAGRIPASGPLKVRAENQNGFAVTGNLSGQTTRPVSASRKRRIKLKAKSFSVAANAKQTLKLRLPTVLRRLLGRKGKLSLRLTAKVKDPAGNTRTVKKKVTPKLKRKRRR
jgi:hypothetical protein